MSTSPLRIDHFLIIFFTFVVMELCICGGSEVCRKEEKQALLCFKNESKVPTNWVDTTDCCSEWDGVVCDNVTGHVVELRPVANNLGAIDVSEGGSFPNGPWNLTYLSSLDLSLNEMNGSLPNQLFGLSYMKSLKLCCNQFHGPLPNDRWNLTSLEVLDVSSNYLNSHIPDSIYHCPNLKVLRLRGNNLQGIISKSISNLTYLSTLVLSNNMLTGEIPKEIGKLKNLNVFLFSSNKFYGPLPESIGYLSSLTILSFLNNKLEGIVTENHFVNLTMLTEIYASGNRLTLRVRSNWMSPFQLYALALSGWNLGPQFPIWLQSQHQIVQLEISNAEIEGEIPKWFWNFSSVLEAIDLSFNQLRGEIQNISIRLPEGSVGVLLYLDSNQFSGSLPSIPIHIIELDLSNNSFSGNISSFLCDAQNVPYNLTILHLGENDLSGEIPDCWMHWPHLEVINVGENQLIGGIPSSIGLLNKLESLDAHKNMLSGHLPPSLQNCTHLLKVDLGENGFTGTIPRWLGTSFSKLKVLRLRLNKLFGELPPTFCHLTSLQILDLANNYFSGVIPRCLDNLTAMITIDENKNEMPSSRYGYFEENALVTTKGHEYI
ncbi:receptor-like protein 47 [Ipomoea triloba]|uniref:receptor-like protein 47 n=1 Tax=Ipomoea triloba TaxID=35885 RepID=UPI00125E8E3E|nr:receptor-like protein 47 [Ipomoea triloba]